MSNKESAAVILVIDDSPENLSVLFDLLSEPDFKILIATDGEQGIRNAELAKPDIILLDILMPGMDGFETCLRLKENRQTRDIPVIFLTAVAEQQQKIKGFSMGAVDFITKPFHREEVLARIATHITLQRQKNELLELNGKLNVLNETLKTEIAKIKVLEDQLRQSQKMEAIGTLAGGIAHDFNNILFPIVGYAEMMLEEYHTGTQGWQNLKEILSATDRARDLVRQILTFSRKSPKELKPLKIQPIIKESLKLLRSSIPTTIEIREDIQDTGPVMADPTQIHQVLMNLCTNAYHAMRDRGGILEVTFRETEKNPVPFPDVSMLISSSYAVLSVRDTGIGMEKAILGKIFDPYFTTKGLGEGTGLGLAVVDGIVREHRGKIIVESEPGKGSLFQIYLPVLSVAKHEMAVSASKSVPTGTEKILVVDDDAQIANMLKMMLEKLGYTVTVRYSSLDALEAFRMQPGNFDLVITDMTMPNMTGVELASEISCIRPGLPVILTTGYSEMVSKETALSYGIREFLMKPVVRDELAKTIRRVLE